MRNSVLCRRMIVLTLVFALIFGIQSISCSQETKFSIDDLRAILNETIIPYYGRTDFSTGTIIEFGSGGIFLEMNGIATTVHAKYANGSWGIETIRSFRWIPDRDNIEDVLLKAKLLKGE